MKNHGIFLSLRRPALKLILSAGLALSLAACSAPQKQVTKTAFFPPPPDEPRLQFLTGFKDSEFMKEKTSTLKLIVTGEQKDEDVVTVDKPLGIVVHNGVIYVCDTHKATVMMIDPVKKRFESIRGNAGPGKLKKPVSLAADADGTLYVADIGRREIMVYTADGDFVRAIGRELDMKKPVGVAVSPENIYVLDNAAATIKVINKSNSQLVREFYGQGTSEEDTLWRPYALALDSQGFIYVTNVGSCKVLKMDADGHALLAFGKQGDAPGMFARPRGISVDNDGRIWVVDAAFQNVQIFNEKGRLLLYFGDPGLPRGSMNIPAGIAFTQDKSLLDYYRKFADPTFEVEALVLVTNQSGFDAVSVYGFGHLKGKGDTAPPQANPAPGPATGGTDTQKANGETSPPAGSSK